MAMRPGRYQRYGHNNHKHQHPFIWKWSTRGRSNSQRLSLSSLSLAKKSNINTNTNTNMNTNKNTNTNTNTNIGPKVWIEKAEDGFVDEDENLMMGEICVRAMKAFATDPDSANTDMDGDGDGDGDNNKGKRFLGAAALVKRRGSTEPSASSNESSYVSSNDIYDCWIADSVLEDTNTQLQGAMLLLDDLFYYHLQRSNANTIQDMTNTFLVQSGSGNGSGNSSSDNIYHSASYMAALNRGFKPLKDFITCYDKNNDNSRHILQNMNDDIHLDHLDLDEEDLDAFVFDTSSDGIERYLNLLNPSSTSSSSSTSSDDISDNDDNNNDDNNENQNSSVAKSIADIIQRVIEPQSELKQQFE